MDTEICTIDISSGTLDNEYTFYESGKIKHYFDQSIYKPNVEEWIIPERIIEDTKKKLIEKCHQEYKKQITKILYPNLSN